jgi:hypothetical protein
MPPRRSARLAGGAQGAPRDALNALPLALPHALATRIWLLVPVDQRMRCREVCPAWRDALEERSIWSILDIAPLGSGVTAVATDALLEAAAARAGGTLKMLRLIRQRNPACLLGVVRANWRSLRVINSVSAYGMCDLLPAVEALLRAAPRLELFLAHVGCPCADVPRVLRNEGILAPLCVESLVTTSDASRANALRDLAALTAALADATVHPSLKHLSFDADPALGSSLPALDAFVDASLARGLRFLEFWNCGLTGASVPAIVRLLAGRSIMNFMLVQASSLLDAPGAALLADELRNNAALLAIRWTADLWADPAAAEALLDGLQGHPTIIGLDFTGNVVPAGLRMRAGRAIAALVAANCPALRHLEIPNWQLGDAALVPLMDALPHNTHLRKLCMGRNEMTEAFAHQRLLPALQANSSLLTLLCANNRYLNPLAHEAERFVAERTLAPHAELGS